MESHAGERWNERQQSSPSSRQDQIVIGDDSRLFKETICLDDSIRSFSNCLISSDKSKTIRDITYATSARYKVEGHLTPTPKLEIFKTIGIDMDSLKRSRSGSSRLPLGALNNSSS